MDSKMCNKIFKNRIETYIKKSVHCDQISFILGMQEWFTIYKVNKYNKHLGGLKDKNHLIILIDK